MTRIFLLALCLALAAPAAPAAWAQPMVSQVRIGEHPDKTRFVMELSEAPRYRVFTLADPFRVVIDLPELRWAPGRGEGDQKGGLIAAMRFGLFAPGTSRVVLDLRAPAQGSRATALARPPQLVSGPRKTLIQGRSRSRQMRGRRERASECPLC